MCCSPSDQVQAVERALAAFRENRVDVVAHQRAAERERVRAEVRVAAKLDLQRGHVEGARAFGLQLVVIDNGVVAGYDFGDRVGEVSAAAASVGFDDGGLAVGARHDQSAGMRGGGMPVGGGFEDQVDGLFDHRAFGDPDEASPSWKLAVFRATKALVW